MCSNFHSSKFEAWNYTYETPKSIPYLMIDDKNGPMPKVPRDGMGIYEQNKFKF